MPESITFTKYPVNTPELLVLAEWFARHVDLWPKDFACERCCPHSDMLAEGFRCVPHQAIDILAATVACDPGEFFLLQNCSLGYCGNSPLWWSIKGGYTDRIDDARMFSERHADGEVRASKSSHNFKKWPVSLIKSIAYLVVDSQDLPKTHP